MSDGARNYDLPPDEGAYVDTTTDQPDLSLVNHVHDSDDELFGELEVKLTSDPSDITGLYTVKHTVVIFGINTDKLLDHNTVIEHTDATKKREVIRALAVTLPEYSSLTLKGLEKIFHGFSDIRNQRLKIGRKEKRKEDIFPIAKTVEALFEELSEVNHPVVQLYWQALEHLRSETPEFYAELRKHLVLSVGEKWVRSNYNAQTKAKAKSINAQGQNQ